MTGAVVVAAVAVVVVAVVVAAGAAAGAESALVGAGSLSVGAVSPAAEEGSTAIGTSDEGARRTASTAPAWASPACANTAMATRIAAPAPARAARRPVTERRGARAGPPGRPSDGVNKRSNLIGDGWVRRPGLSIGRGSRGGSPQRDDAADRVSTRSSALDGGADEYVRRECCPCDMSQ